MGASKYACIRFVLARLGRSSGSKSDVTHSLEGFGVTEAGRPRGHPSGGWEKCGASLRAHLLAAPSLIQPPGFLPSSQRPSSRRSSPPRGGFQTTCSLPPRASLPEVQRYLAWISLSLSMGTRAPLPLFFSIPAPFFVTDTPACVFKIKDGGLQGGSLSYFGIHRAEDTA